MDIVEGSTQAPHVTSPTGTIQTVINITELELLINKTVIELVTRIQLRDNDVRNVGGVTASERKAAVDASSLLTWDDATWILTSSFIIFTMQSGKVGTDIRKLTWWRLCRLFWHRRQSLWQICGATNDVTMNSLTADSIYPPGRHRVR